MAQEQFGIREVVSPSHETLRGMKYISKQLNQFTQKRFEGVPRLLVSPHEYKQAVLYPPSSSPPILLQTTELWNGKQLREGVMITYWSDENSRVPTGIIHKESILLLREGNDVKAYTYSDFPNSPFTTSNDKHFIKQAKALWKSLDTTLSTSLRDIEYALTSQEQPANKKLLFRRLGQAKPYRTHLLASQFVLTHMQKVLRRENQEHPAFIRRGKPSNSSAKAQEQIPTRSAA